MYLKLSGSPWIAAKSARCHKDPSKAMWRTAYAATHVESHANHLRRTQKTAKTPDPNSNSISGTSRRRIGNKVASGSRGVLSRGPPTVEGRGFTNIQKGKSRAAEKKTAHPRPTADPQKNQETSSAPAILGSNCDLTWCRLAVFNACLRDAPSPVTLGAKQQARAS